MKRQAPPTLLFSSLSAKIALYEEVLKSARRYHDEAKVIGADCNADCPARKRVQSFSLIPALEDMDESFLLDYCSKLELTHVIPTRDGELEFWANHQDRLAEHGVQVMLSSPQAIRICKDKLLFFQSMAKSPTPAIATAEKIAGIESERFVVKERTGAAAESIGINLSREQAVIHAEKLEMPIFQPMVSGSEFSAETWIDADGNAHGMVLRWRTKIINGESHESEIFENREWEESMRKTFKTVEGLSGHVLGQALVDGNGELHLIEINPRLGGASPLALAAGLNSIEWFLLQSEGFENDIPALPSINKHLRLKKADGEVEISS